MTMRSPGSRPFLLLCSSSVVAFFPSLLARDFVFDDLPAIVNNADVSNSSSPFTAVFRNDFWGDPLSDERSHKSYRPLSVLVLRLLHSLSASSSSSPPPLVFHLANVCLHCLNTCLAFSLSRLVLGSRRLATWSALVFSAHPVHAEAVAACVGLADLLCSLLILVAILVYFRIASCVAKVIFATCLTAIAVLVKEQGIMVVPVVLAMDLIWRHDLDVAKFKISRMGSFAAKLIPMMAAASAILCARLWAMDFQPPKFQEQDNPAAFLDSRTLRVLNRAYQYALNLWLLLAPDWLCFDWAMGCVPLITTPADPRLLAVVSATLLGIMLLLRCLSERDDRTRKALLSSAALGALPFLPSSNVFFNVGFVVAERNLYLTLIGHALLVSLGLRRLCRGKRGGRKKTILRVLFYLLLAAFFAKSWLRSHQWRSEMKLFSSGLAVCPQNAKVHYNLAKLSADAGDVDSAVSLYRLSLLLHPDYEHALNNLGNLRRSQPGGLPEAEELLRRATRVSPRFAAAWMNLGIVLAARGGTHSGDAEDAYLTSLALRKHCPDCYFNLGNLYLKTGRKGLAFDSFQQAISQNGRLRHAWSNLVILSDELGKFQTAEQKALEAIEIFPEAAEFRFHLANVYGKEEKYADAEKRYQEALALKPDDALYLANLGVLYHRWGRKGSAVEAYGRALRIDPTNGAVADNLRKLGVSVGEKETVTDDSQLL